MQFTDEYGMIVVKCKHDGEQGRILKLYGQFFVIFALILTGYFFSKINIISEGMSKGLYKFLVCLPLPCFLFHKIANMEIEDGLLEEFALTFFLSLLIFTFYGFYAFWYAKIRRFPREDAGVAEIMMLLPNNGYMGFPITYIVFGDIGLLFMTASNIVTVLTTFTYGIFALRRTDTDKKFSFKIMLKIISNPMILAVAAGFACYFLNVRMPGPVDTYIVYLGSICTPLIMIVIGSFLVGTNVLHVVKDRMVLEPAVNKILVLPVLTFLLVIFLPIPDMVKAILVFAAVFPSATVAVLITGTEEKNTALAGKIFVLSTAAAVITLPIASELIYLLIL